MPAELNRALKHAVHGEDVEWPREEEALPGLDIGRGELCPLVVVLDALGNDLEIQGSARAEGEVPRVGRPASDELIAVESGFQEKYRDWNPKYRGRPDAALEYDRGHAWLRIRSEKITSWDFRKI